MVMETGSGKIVMEIVTLIESAGSEMAMETLIVMESGSRLIGTVIFMESAAG